MSSSVFQFDEKTVGELIKAFEFEVPLYQRSYSWTDEATEFFEDIMAHRNNGDQYFIGPMVFLKKNSVLEVIDGQQRLVTACLILASLRDICRELNVSDPSGNEVALGIDSSYIHRSAGFYAKPELFIKPNKIDRHLFTEIVRSSTDFETKEKSVTDLIRQKKYESWKNMWKAYKDFYAKQSSELKSIKKEKRYLYAYSVGETLDKRIQAAEITVDTEQDAFLVFESLNAKGLQLAPVDLIKNYLFSQIKDEQEIADNEVKWETFLDQVNPNELTMIIRYQMMLTEGFLREKEVFKRIREKIATKSAALHFIDDVNKFLGYYTNMIKPTHKYWASEELSDWIEDLHGLKVTQHVPVLFELLERYHQPSKFKEWVKPLYLTLIKRIITKRSPSEFEKTIAHLVESVGQKNETEFLKRLKILLPDKVTVETSLNDAVLDSGKGRRLSKLLLRTLENTKGDEERANKDLTLEHIWPESKKDDLHDDSLCFRIGNMTLLMGVPNKKARDYPYAKKKKIYKKSKLQLNIQLLKSYKTWSEKSIVERSRQVSKDIVASLKF